MESTSIFTPVVAGDCVCGSVTALHSATSKFVTDPIPIVILRSADGDVAVRGFHAALRSQIVSAAPRVGDDLVVTYLGKKPYRSFSTYHAYDVRTSTPG